MNLIFLLVISSFFLPCFIGKCIENVNKNLTNSASIYNGSYSQINELAECKEIHKENIENEQKVGQRRFKRSGRRGSIRRGLSKITGGLSLRDRKNSIANALSQRNAPFLGNRYNPMRVDPQFRGRANIPKAPPIDPAFRAKMAPRQPMGQLFSPTTFSQELQRKFESRAPAITKDLRAKMAPRQLMGRAKMAPRQPMDQLPSPRAFSRELRQKVKSLREIYEHRKRRHGLHERDANSYSEFLRKNNGNFAQSMNPERGQLFSLANNAMFFGPQFYRDRQIIQRRQLELGLETGYLFHRLPAHLLQNDPEKYLRYQYREIPEPPQ